MTRSHPPFKYMNNFKAFAIDYEYYLTLSDEPQSVCLTERQMYVLSVQNSYTYWLTRWYNTDDITQKTVEFIAAEIEALLMCGCGVPAPTITDVMNGQSYVTTTNNFYNTTYNTWNAAGQTVESIAPNMDYPTGVPANIDKLVCLGLEMFLQTIIQQAQAIKAGDFKDSQDLMKQLASIFGALGAAGGAATLVGGVAGSVVAFLGGPWLVLGLILAGIGMTVASIVMPMDDSVFTDAEAFNDVYCTMMNNLVGGQITYSAFQNALTPNDFTPGSLSAQLASVVQAFLNDQTMYLQFMVAMNELYPAMNFGVMPECGCVAPGYEPFMFEPGFEASGTYDGNAAGGTFTAAEDSGVWRVCFKFSAGGGQMRFVSWVPSADVLYKNRYVPFANPSNAEWTSGLEAGDAIVVGECWGGALYGHNAPFTITAVFEPC